ncbi:MAG: TonB-dependent receptor, partial [Sphingomonadales bacterium]
MRAVATLLAGACAAAIAVPLHAQDTTATTTTTAPDRDDSTTIVVTAQRRAESLQAVPIAVSAFDSEALEKQQIDNASDLQLTLPNVSFTKSNFTSSSFTIRGIGDLCVGTSCDSATAIHVNGSPLFGRNATSGVVNIVTAKPNLSDFGAAAEFEYGNYDSIKAKGMINIPIGDTLGVRVA